MELQTKQTANIRSQDGAHTIEIEGPARQHCQNEQSLTEEEVQSSWGAARIKSPLVQAEVAIINLRLSQAYNSYDHLNLVTACPSMYTPLSTPDSIASPLRDADDMSRMHSKMQDFGNDYEEFSDFVPPHGPI